MEFTENDPTYPQDILWSDTVLTMPTLLGEGMAISNAF